MINPNLSPKEINMISKRIPDYSSYDTLHSQSKQPKKKYSIGIYSLTSCYGCQLSIAVVPKILEIANAVDIKCYYMISSKSSIHEKVDIAFIEGSVSTEQDLEELKEIRNNCKVLVAIGACSINGGVQSWGKDDYSYQQLYSKIYGDNKINYTGLKATPIEKYVQVDYKLPGCPPEEDEIIYFLTTLISGTWPDEKDYPVCQECRLAGNPCILIENGVPCLGPVTTAGCDARCIKYNIPCIGCRGPVENETAWFDSLAKVFVEKGFSEEYIQTRMSIFGSHNPSLKVLLWKVFHGDNNK